MTQRKPKVLEGTMGSEVLTPKSSVKSTNTIDSQSSETRDCFYFPGCRKDANCNCEICIASINATLDLMPQSIHGSSLTKFSTSRPTGPRSPVPFASSAHLSTPKSSAQARPATVSPILNPSVSFQEKTKRRKRQFGYRIFMVRFLLGLILICCVEYGLSFIVSRVLKARLSPEDVRNLGEKLCDIGGLSAKFLFLKNELEGFVEDDVSSCTSVDSLWKISQDGLLLNSRCALYKSMAEEVSIWGWPLQTAGLLTAEYSSRSLSIISGRVTEWKAGEAMYLVRKGNSSWTQGKWSSSVVQHDSNTWILEYRQSFLLENSRLVSAALEFSRFRLTRQFEKMMKQEFWLPSAFGSRHPDFITGGSTAVPT